jgi:hypothetical protein
VSLQTLGTYYDSVYNLCLRSARNHFLTLVWNILLYNRNRASSPQKEYTILKVYFLSKAPSDKLKNFSNVDFNFCTKYDIWWRQIQICEVVWNHDRLVISVQYFILLDRKICDYNYRRIKPNVWVFIVNLFNSSSHPPINKMLNRDKEWNCRNLYSNYSPIER